MNIPEITHMRNPANFETIYPEWKADRELRKMERKNNRKRTREDVLFFMKEYNQKPLPVCLRCDMTCIQREVYGLLSFKCFIKEPIGVEG